jgi:hypothetical protein
MLAGGGKEIIQDKLIASTQGAPEFGKCRFFLQECLRDGRYGTPHT